MIVQIVDCLKEILINGDAVVLGELGKFYVTLNSEGSQTYAKFSANNIKNVKVKFSPSSEFEDLISESSFNHVGTRKQQISNIKVEATDEDKKPQGGNTPSGPADDDDDMGF